MRTAGAPPSRDVETALTPPELAAASWCQPIDYWRACSTRLPGGVFHEDDAFTWFASDFDAAPWFNQVMMTNVSDAEADAGIDDRLAYFRDKNRPMLWYVAPHTRPADLTQRLLARGFESVGSRLTAMTIDLADVPSADLPSGLEIERVMDQAGLERWFSGYVAGFDTAREALRPFFHLYNGFGFDADSPFIHFAGLLDGEVVASATLFTGGGVAGVWHVGTAPAARRRGVGNAMTHATLQAGRKLGHHYGVLQASGAGLSIYQKLGFAEHGYAVQYRWSPTS